MALHNRIKERRIELNMSQQELADILGYRSRSSINKIEQGINDIPQSKIKDFAVALKTTSAQLMGYDEQNNIKPMSDIKERIFGAVTVMNEKDAASLWKIIIDNFADWSGIEEVPPYADEIEAIKRGEMEYRNGEIYSHDEVWS